MALVKFRDVMKALDICAPGYTLRETPHRFKIYYNGLAIAGVAFFRRL